VPLDVPVCLTAAPVSLAVAGHRECAKSWHCCRRQCRHKVSQSPAPGRRTFERGTECPRTTKSTAWACLGLEFAIQFNTSETRVSRTLELYQVDSSPDGKRVAVRLVQRQLGPRLAVEVEHFPLLRVGVPAEHHRLDRVGRRAHDHFPATSVKPRLSKNK